MTLKEIAKIAGVSTATVSYVLNGSNKVSEQTRRKIEKIIKETGYQSNILARGLRKSESHLIGLLVEDLTTWHTPHVIDGINELAEAKGYQTILGNLGLYKKIHLNFDKFPDCKDEIHKKISMLLSMQVDGIIYIGMHDRVIRNIFPDISKPLIHCDCFPADGGSCVTYNNEKASYELTNLFIQNGHRDFAVVKGDSNEPSMARLRGIKAALREYNIPLKEEYIIEGNWDYHTTCERIRPILKQPNRPTAYVCVSDKMAIAVQNEAIAQGLSIPDDISISGFDYDDTVIYNPLKLATAEIPFKTMGYRSIEMLLNKIETGNNDDISIVLPCAIIKGESISHRKCQGHVPEL